MKDPWQVGKDDMHCHTHVYKTSLRWQLGNHKMHCRIMCTVAVIDMHCHQYTLSQREKHSMHYCTRADSIHTRWRLGTTDTQRRTLAENIHTATNEKEHFALLHANRHDQHLVRSQIAEPPRAVNPNQSVDRGSQAVHARQHTHTWSIPKSSAPTGSVSPNSICGCWPLRSSTQCPSFLWDSHAGSISSTHHLSNSSGSISPLPFVSIFPKEIFNRVLQNANNQYKAGRFHLLQPSSFKLLWFQLSPCPRIYTFKYDVQSCPANLRIVSDQTILLPSPLPWPYKLLWFCLCPSSPVLPCAERRSNISRHFFLVYQEKNQTY